MVAALIDTEDEAYLDLNGCLGVINMAVEDSRTDFAAVERMRRCMLINTRQYKNTLPTKYLIGRFIQETIQETCWRELSARSQEPCKNCTQYPLLLLIVQVASTFHHRYALAATDTMCVCIFLLYTISIYIWSK